MKSVWIFVGILVCLLGPGLARIDQEGTPNPVLLNVCLNGRDPAKMSNKDYMTEFVNGPCAPLILAPGIGGSVLEVEIECEKLLLTDYDTFISCGWLDCKAGSKVAPHKEYRIWVPDIESPMSLLTPLDLNKRCWGGLIGQKYDTVAGQVVPVKKIGVTVRPLGTTPLTYTKPVSGCGINGVKDIIPGIINPEYSAYFSDLVKELLVMGYREGLTLVGLPYDFRAGEGYDDFDPMLTYSLGQLNKLSGKKVVVMAHSMSNNRMLNALWKMPQADKDALIHNYLAMAPSWLGSVSPLLYLTCGNPDFYFKGNLGIDFKRWKESVGEFLSTFELSPSRIYRFDRFSPWMEQIKKRIAYEEGKSSSPGDIDFIPTRDQVCYNNYNNKNCRSGLTELDNYGTFNGTTLNNENYREFINDHGYLRNMSSIWNLFEEKYETTLPNPGVQINIIYTTVVDTDSGYTYKEDPRTFTDKDQFCPSSSFTVLNTTGDQTVPSTSVVTPGYKWALDFKNNVTNAKPIKFIEMCSYQNQAPSPYDGKDSKGVNRVTKNGYIGMPCDCSQGKVRHCDHNTMLFLPNLLSFAAQVAQTNEIVPLPAFVANMTEAQLSTYMEQCRALVQTIPTQTPSSATE